MKLNNLILRASLPLLFAAAGFSCSKQQKSVLTEDRDFSTDARVQLYNVTLGVQRNFVYLEGNRVSGASLTYTNATYSPLFPASGNSFAVGSGLKAITVRDTLLTSTVQPVLNFSENFEPNKFYTIFTYDTVNAIKQKTVETHIETDEQNRARVRLANFVYSKAGVPSIDVYSKVKNANVFTDVPLTAVTDFIPYDTDVADSLIVRTAGTMIALDTAVITFRQKRSYTLVFRGRFASNGAGGATYPRTLSSFVNY